jgi:DNA-binding MarR family transcriptional regulator
MEPNDLRTLKILEAVEGNHLLSQRALAKKLNISLGLANAFVKRMASEGYFKMQSTPKNRISYVLTSKGAAEKTRLTYRYIQYSFEFYKQSRHKLRQLFRQLQRQGIVRIVFFGATDLAEIAYLAMQETSLELVGVIDDTRQDKRFVDGRQILGTDRLGQMSFDCVLITYLDAGLQRRLELIEIGIAEKHILLIR